MSQSLYTIEQLEKNLTRYAEREDISNVLVVYKNACWLWCDDKEIDDYKAAQIRELINNCEETIIDMCKPHIKKKAGY